MAKNGSYLFFCEETVVGVQFFIYVFVLCKVNTCNYQEEEVENLRKLIENVSSDIKVRLYSKVVQLFGESLSEKNFFLKNMKKILRTLCVCHFRSNDVNSFL